jgi:hypothetical protein
MITGAGTVHPGCTQGHNRSGLLTSRVSPRFPVEIRNPSGYVLGAIRPAWAGLESSRARHLGAILDLLSAPSVPSPAAELGRLTSMTLAVCSISIGLPSS